VDYRELLKHYLKLREVGRPVGVREAQRILGFSSPGKAQRLLRKLERMGLAEKTEDGKYAIRSDPPLELIGKVVVRGRLLPKILVLATYTTTITAVYVLLAKPPLDVLLLLLLINIPLWLEAVSEYVELRRRGL